MNLQMSLQKQADWTPSLDVFGCSHHSRPRNSSKQFSLEGVLHI